MNKSIALILSLLAVSVTVGCGSSDNNSPGPASAGSSGAGDSSGGDGSSKAGADSSAAGDSSTGDTGNTSDAGSPGDSGGSSSGGSSSGGSGDGAAGAPNPTNADCKKLETCCVGLTSGSDGTGGPKGACEHIAGLNYAPSCVSTYSLYKCDSVIAMENQPKSSACKIDTMCTRTAYNASSDSLCASAEMGTASENCPADGVVGCCKLPGVTEYCTYEGNSSPITDSDCKAMGGTFSTTP